MVEWFRSLPKTIFVTLVLGAGVLFIVIADPPRTVCDSQMVKFKEASDNFLTVDKKKRPNLAVSKFSSLLDTCKSTNSAGGCYALFMGVKKLIKDAGAVSTECYGKLRSYDKYDEAIWQSLDVMARLAWGAQPPITAVVKAGWFDPADLNLFCELKKTAENVISKDKWKVFVEGYFKSLPGAAALERGDAWSKMIFSTQCGSYQ